MGGQRLHVLLAIACARQRVPSASAESGLRSGRRAAAEQEGGIFRISLNSFSGIDYMDPALASSPPGWALLDTTCARLLAYPDKPPPEGFRLQPEVAAGFPAVSRDGRTYTFTLRSGFRFSDGTPVRASAFARAINRALAPEMNSPGVQYVRDIVGAGRVLTGKSAAADRGRGAREHARRPIDAACAGLPAPDGVDVLLRRTPGTARRPRRSRRLPGSRPVLRHRVPARRAGRAPPEPRTTAAGGRTTSTASTSTSVPHRPRRCSSASIEARPTGGTRSPRSTSIRLSVSVSSRSTGSIARSCSSGVGSRCGCSRSTRRARCSATTRVCAGRSTSLSTGGRSQAVRS